MRTGELIDEAVAVYQKVGLRMLGMLTLPLLLVAACVVFGSEYVIPALSETSNPENVAVQVGEAAFTLCIALFVAVPLVAGALSYACALAASLTADHIMGRVVDFEAAQRAARKALPALIKATLGHFAWLLLGYVVAVLFLFVGALTLDSDTVVSTVTSAGAYIALIASLVVGPLVLFRFSLAPQGILFEDLSARKALRRSAALLRKAAWAPSGYSGLFEASFVIGLVLLLLGSGFASIAALFDLDQHLDTLASLSPSYELGWMVFDLLFVEAVLLLPVPLWGVITTLTYFERRARIEGYDIDTLALEARRASKEARFQL